MIPDRFNDAYDPDYDVDRPSPSEYADLDTPKRRLPIDPEVFVQHPGDPF